MASKSTLVFFTFFLFIARMGSSVEQVHNVKNENVHHHHHLHHHAKAPVDASAKAPVHAPTAAPVHAPARSPFYSLPKPPAASSPPHGCVAMCASYCRPVSPKRPCMRTCTACCDKFRCVPGFARCSRWEKVAIHGYLVKCP